MAQQGGSSASLGVTPAPAQISRQGDGDLIELEIDPDCPEGMICFNILNGNKAHHALSQAEKDAIVTRPVALPESDPIREIGSILRESGGRAGATVIFACLLTPL